MVIIALLAVAINYGTYQLAAITNFLETGHFTSAIASFGVYLGIQLIIPILELACNLSQNRAQKVFCLYFRNELSEKTLQFSLKDYRNYDCNYFLNGNVNGIEIFNQYFVENLFNCFYYMLLIMCGLVMLSQLYFVLSLAMAGAIILSSLCAHIYDKAIERLTEVYLSKEKKYLNSIIDVVDGFLDIYFSRCRGFFCRTTKKHIKEYEQANITYHSKLKALGMGLYLPMFLADMSILGLILHGILTNNIGLDVLVAYLSIGGLLLNSGENFFASLSELKSGIEAISWDVLEYQNQPPTLAGKYDSNQILAVENLLFSYNEHAHISMQHFTLFPGEKILLYGASGTGKSTFLKLLTRQLDLKQGAVLVNGQNLASFSEEDIYNRIGYFPQTGGLFQGSLRENIFFDNQVSSHFADEIIRRSMLTDFVKQHGLEYRISRGGTNVSGGERQRILLARLFAQRKQILLMDEPFANMPYSLGQIIEESFIFEDDVSVILISHDLNGSYRKEYKLVEINH